MVHSNSNVFHGNGKRPSSVTRMLNCSKMSYSDCAHYSYERKSTTTKIMTMMILNQDCLISIFEHLSMMERLKCRSVCQQWKQAVDKMAIGENSLEIYAVHPYLAMDARQKSGLIDQDEQNQQQQLINQQRRFKPWFIEYIIYQWSKFGENLISVEPIENISDDDDNDDTDSDDNDRIQFNDIINSKSYIWPYSSPFSTNFESSSLPNLNDILSSHYYWNYAFCATSSLFSTFVATKSKEITHKFSHSFCQCRCKNRFKYSIILDQQSCCLMKMNNLLQRFPNIHHLHMKNVNELNDIILALITQHCHHLRHLSFVNCQQQFSTITTTILTANDHHQPTPPPPPPSPLSIQQQQQKDSSNNQNNDNSLNEPQQQQCEPFLSLNKNCLIGMFILFFFPLSKC